MNVYCISGLGVDGRVFQRIGLPDYVSVHYLDWILPLYREPVVHYAQRLAASINTHKPFVLIGMSFGGMIAVEMNRLVHPQKTIIISSAATKYGLPPYFRLAGWLRLHKIIPVSFLKKPNPLFHWLFGIDTEEEKKLFKALLRDAHPEIVQWSIRAVLHWQNTYQPAKLIHLHGDNDRMLPVRWARPDITVKGGKHFMVFSKGEELSGILTQILEEVAGTIYQNHSQL